jgi:hypothetical protein
MTNADPMAASGHANMDVHTEAHSLPSKAGARVASRPENAAKNELQKFQIAEVIQPFDQKTADLNSILENIGGQAKAKKRHLSPKRVKAPRKRGAPPGNRNALKHGNYTRERRAFFADVRAHIRHSREILSEIPLRLVHGGPGRPREHW